MTNATLDLIYNKVEGIVFRFIAVIFIFISTILAADEQTDIQNTISNQLEAFASDDFTEAFTHASPGTVSYTHLTLPTNREV